MNDDQLDKLFAAARQEKPDTSRAEYGFETRLMARLRAQPEPWWTWAWRLMPGFAAVVVALAVWDFAAPGQDDWPALMDGGHSEQALVSYLTGE